MESTWEEMRQANPAQVVKVVGNAAVKIVERSDYRVGLIIAANGAATVYLGFDSTVANQTGLPLTAAQPVLSLSLITHGRLVRGDIWAIAPAGNQNVTVWEVLHPCACLE